MQPCSQRPDGAGQVNESRTRCLVSLSCSSPVSLRDILLRLDSTVRARQCCTRRLPDHVQIPQRANIAEHPRTLASMAIAAKQGMSSSQRSPTLSDAGMILPGFEAERVRSTSPVFERPPSVSALYDAYQSPKLSFPPQNRRRFSQQKQSPPLSAQSSRSTLRDMGDSGADPKRSPPRNDKLASSPTIDANASHDHHAAGSWEEQEQRRFSTASSMLSEDFENWPGFDSHENFDDSGVDLEEQERRGGTSNGPVKGSDDSMENEQWMHGRQGESDEDDIDDPYSSAALSRRAELILANAKKRLNVCAARYGLLVARPLTATGYGG